MTKENPPSRSGEPGPGDGPAGDILLTIRVSPHPHFRRTGNRLDVRVPVTLAEAIQGATVDVPTPHGTIS
jgi:DnaJ-class molecular chaperone